MTTGQVFAMNRCVRRCLLALTVLAATALSFAQTPATDSTDRLRAPTGLRAHGKFTVDGTPSQTSANLFDNSTVLNDAAIHTSVMGEGNSLVFAPKSDFVAKINAYLLKSGGSKVATHTGMTAGVGCFYVTPVTPVYFTQYEVNWSGTSVFVYARNEDVYIIQGRPEDENRRSIKDEIADDKNRRWLVKAGHTARISEVHLCKPLVDILPWNNLGPALGLAATTGTAAMVPITWDDDQLSSDHP